MADFELPPRDDRLLLSVAEAAAALAVSRTTFYELMWRGEITPIRIGRCVRIPKADLLRFIDECRPRS